MPQTLTASVGLLARKGTPVPLLGVSAEVQLRDYACRVVLSQRFRNDEPQPIEAVYKFPLDEGAAVCGFEVEIDGRRVVGRAEEREQAFAAYDDALAEGHGAYLLDEERADVFTASVGNLPPGQEAVLRITTVCELPLEGDAIRFTLPTTVAPRYAPAEDCKGVGETEAARVSPPFALQVPYGLHLKLDVETSAPVRLVESPSHPLAVTIENGRATVTLSTREASLDRDVVVKITLAETHQPRGLVERGADGAAYALLSFRPRFEAKAAAAEVVFVVDRSGSMQGTSIAEARNALQLALRSLRPGCCFNILGFGSSYEALFPESRPYDDASLAEATAHVKGLEADLGGTEILPALEHVLAGAPRAGLARQLFVLTDGEVSNTDAVIALARRHAGHTRVFTFGIGAGASHHLVQGLARAGEGEAEFIAPGERIEAKVMRQLSRALTAALTEVTLDWGGLGVEQAPFEVPPVFADGRVLVFGRLEQAGAGSVTLRATGAEGSLAFPLSLALATAPEGSLVATLWARRRIRDLEEGRSALHPRRGSQQARAVAPNADAVKAEIVRLGTTWGLASRYTSFVAVETRETPTQAEAQLRRIPVAITNGWHGVQEVPQQCGPLFAPSPALAIEDCYMEDFAEIRRVALRDAPAVLSDRDASRPLAASSPAAPRSSWLLKALGGLAKRSPAPASGPLAPSDERERPLDSLVALQRADGAWNLDDDLARALGWAGAKQLRASLGPPPASEPEERAFATALALAWLERHCAESRDEWHLLAEKGHDWLELAPGGADTWLARAKAVLAT